MSKLQFYFFFIKCSTLKKRAKATHYYTRFHSRRGDFLSQNKVRKWPLKNTT